MASRNQIQMDFDMAARQADELDNIASTLNIISSKDFSDMLNRLGNDWKGDNANKYIHKGYILTENMQKTVASIQQTASTIRAIAKNIYDAEMEALRIAEEREAAERRAAEEREAAEKRARTYSNGGGGGFRF